MVFSDESDPARWYNALIAIADEALNTHRRADAARAYHDAMLILEHVFGSDNDMVAAVADALTRSAFVAGEFALDEQGQRRLLAHALRRYGPDHVETAFITNNLACDLRELGRFEEAEELARRALAVDQRLRAPDDPKIPHRLNNVATILILRGGRERLVEAAGLNGRAWGLKAGRHDVTSLRILFNRVRIAMLLGADAGQYLGQLKVLLAAPSLANAGDVAATWGCESVVRSLREPGALGREQAELLLGLVGVLNGRASAEGLDAFGLWREAVPVALSEPWPELAALAG